MRPGLSRTTDLEFYATAYNFSTSIPRDLLKFPPINSTILDIPKVIAAYRIQYTSQALNGANVPVTGFIPLFVMPFMLACLDRDLSLWGFGFDMRMEYIKYCIPDAVCESYFALEVS